MPENLENSNIMKDNFIKGIHNSRRKISLLKAIEKYKRFKLFGKIKHNNTSNNSFTFGIEQKRKQKSIEKINSINNYNIIEEDENENSQIETIQNYPQKK